jgi:hypothetical protein
MCKDGKMGENINSTIRMGVLIEDKTGKGRTGQKKALWATLWKLSILRIIDCC